MNKIDKYDAEIKSQINSLEGKEKKAVKDILDGFIVDCVSQEQQLLIRKYKQTYRELLQHAVCLDGITTTLIRTRHSDIVDRKETSNEPIENYCTV